MVCEVNDGCAVWQVDDIAFRREDEYAMLEKVHLERFEKLLDVSDILLRLFELLDPFILFSDIAFLELYFFLICVMGGDTVLSFDMHFFGADLHFNHALILPGRGLQEP